MVNTDNMKPLKNKPDTQTHINISGFECRSHQDDFQMRWGVRHMEMYSECVASGIITSTATCQRTHTLNINSHMTWREKK